MTYLEKVKKDYPNLGMDDERIILALCPEEMGFEVSGDEECLELGAENDQYLKGCRKCWNTEVKGDGV